MRAPERDPLARGFPRTSEPFGFTANRWAYIPREATEAALAELIACVRRPSVVTALTGPPGLGKTLLLHLLSDRLDAELHPVFLAYGALPPEDFCAIVLDRLGSPRTDDPVGVLKAYARHLAEEGSGLLLLIDDAGAIPSETLRWFCHLARSGNGSIRCVFAVTDGVESSEVVAALGSEAALIRLATPMTREETNDYVEAHLAVGRVSGAVRGLFDQAAVTRLHEVSGGVPRRLHTAAQALLRQQPDMAPHDAALDEDSNVLDAPNDGAATRIAPAIQEEIERLRRDAVGRRAAPPKSWSRRAVAMSVAFAAAVVLGLGIATSYRPLSTWLAFSSRPSPGESAGAAVEVTFPNRTRELLAIRASPPPVASEPAFDETAPPTSTGEPLAFGESTAPQLETSPSRAAPLPETIRSETPPSETAHLENPPSHFVQPGGESPESVAGHASPAAGSVAADAEKVSVNINANPWATVELDDVALGETPLAGVLVTAGPHSFRAHMPDGSVIERTIEIDAENRFVVFEMAPAAPAEAP